LCEKTFQMSCSILLVATSTPVPTPAPSAASANEPSGPRLQAELLKTIDATTAKVGDEVTLKTIQPLNLTARSTQRGRSSRGTLRKWI